MIIDFSRQSPTARYAWMTQAIIPRPIAWILSENADGGLNLAPFSYFNALASDPPLLGVSIAGKPDGTKKDTLANILARPKFVVHIAPVTEADAVNASSATLPAGESELRRLNLPTTPICADFPLPRLSAAPVALACRLYREIALSPVQTLLIGQIDHLHIDDHLITTDDKSRPKIAAQSLNPLARLGAGEYAGLTAPFTRKRPE